MSKTWLFIEKFIATVLVIWGIVALYGLTKTIVDMMGNNYVTAHHITYGSLILKNHLNLLLALASLFGGSMLLFNDRYGWLLSVICSLLYMATFTISTRANSTDTTQPYYQFYKSYSVMGLLFLAFFILLLQKPFRQKYRVNGKAWLWAILVTLVLLVDKLMF